MEKYLIFSRVFDIANQLLTRHSSFAPLGQDDGWKVVCQNFFGLWLLKHRKSVLYRQRRSNFSRRQCPKRKTDSYVVSGCDNDISRGWERKSMAERLVTGRVWPCTWKMSSVGKDLVKNWEICVLKITPIVWFCNVSTHFFILSLSTNALYDFYSGIVDPYTFIH